jgi:hypothetical protein
MQSVSSSINAQPPPRWPTLEAQIQEAYFDKMVDPSEVVDVLREVMRDGEVSSSEWAALDGFADNIPSTLEPEKAQSVLELFYFDAGQGGQLAPRFAVMRLKWAAASLISGAEALPSRPTDAPFDWQGWDFGNHFTDPATRRTWFRAPDPQQSYVREQTWDGQERWYKIPYSTP